MAARDPKPAAPTKPPKAAKSAKPTKPANAKPANPATPVAPTKPAKSAAPKKPAKPAKPIDPHRLIKRDDGYVSADGRFEVSGTPGSFYLADSARLNPFGLPTIDGPYRTLTELRAAVAAAVDDGGTRG